ncbi:S-adenosyl-L-methionine-dependent methyltransferase [Aureobasidium pullulans]|uniref:S-adenosyl-L-methionine-dependent methyltransferase n=1 Tax=Aureobasidium pullulans TaxID=5580 RepID=A0A4V4IYY6_AURPU|nr:S-adenosyl-L-methionine-dependent methyltransferase [Aureobasidium pullulans]
MSSTTTTPPMLKVSSADWDKTSASYAQHSSKSPTSIPIQRLIELLDTLTPLSTASAILDVGCGPGAATAQIIDTHSANIDTATQLLAGDFSIGMVRLVSQLRKTKLAELSVGHERDLWTRVTPLVLDATDMRPVLDQSVSHIIANLVFFMTENPAKAVAESYRVLSQNGVMACSSWAKMAWMECLAIAADRIFPPLGKPVPAMPQFPVQWASVEGIEQQLANAKFRDIHTEYTQAPIVVPNLEAWSHFFMNSGNPAVSWITDELDDAGVQEAEKQFIQVVKEQCEVNENGAYVLSGTAVLAVGRNLAYDAPANRLRELELGSEINAVVQDFRHDLSRKDVVFGFDLDTTDESDHDTFAGFDHHVDEDFDHNVAVECDHDLVDEFDYDVVAQFDDNVAESV